MIIRALPILAAIACLAVVLFGCGTAPPERVVTQTVYVPTPVRCKAAARPSIEYPDSDEALRTAPDMFERVKLLLAGRNTRSARIQELESSLKACE